MAMRVASCIAFSRKALSSSFDDVDDHIEEVFEKLGLSGVIDLYLSPEHIANPGLGCPVPALASEIGRQPGDLASLFTARLNRRIEFFAAKVPGETAAERLELAKFIFCSMAGAVAIARAMDDPEQRESILLSTKNQLQKLINFVPR